MGKSHVPNGTTWKGKCKNPHCQNEDWLEYCRVCNPELYYKEKKGK